MMPTFNGKVVDEFDGFTNDADAWTGTKTDGNVLGGETCNDWTSTSHQGSGTEADAQQMLRQETGRTCGTQYAVFCVQVNAN
jgi:hypothetical protein